MLYVGVIFFLILQFLRPQEFVPLLYGLRLVYWTMILLVPIWAIKLQWKKLLRTPVDLMIFGFYLICILSWWNYYKSRMFLPGGPVFTLIPPMLIYFLTAHAVDTRQKLVGGVWMVFLSLIIIGLLAGEDVGLTGQYASIGMFDNRNDFAYAMAILAPIGFAFLLAGSAPEKIAGLGAMILAFGQVVASGSRGGLLATLGAVYAVLLTRPRRAFVRFGMALAGIIAFGFVLSFSPRLQTVGGYTRDGSAMGRVEVWGMCLTLFRNHRFIGHGARTWLLTPGTPRDTHSSYMRVLFELGTIGLFIYLGVFFYAMRASYKITQQGSSGRMRVMGLAIFGILAGQTIGSVLQTRVYYPFVFAILGLSSALLLVSSREQGQIPEPTGRADWPPDRLSGLTPDLWNQSAGSGFSAPGLWNKRDFYIIAGLTFLCWLVHKLFVMRSY